MDLEIFEALGLEWWRHDGSENCPCPHLEKIDLLFWDEPEPTIEQIHIDDLDSWADSTILKKVNILGWRPADAPAKLPRKGGQVG